jgi:hypothetical protein
VRLVSERAPGGSEPRVTLESRTSKGIYLAWKGKLPETAVKLSMGVLDRKAIRVKSRKRVGVWLVGYRCRARVD